MREDKYNGVRKRNDAVRLLAIAAMTIDHIGAFLFPQYIILRIIGRFTMPVFAYGVASGIIHSKNREKYILRLLVFAVLSQLPFSLVGAQGLNIIATIAVTAIFLYLVEKRKPLFTALSVVPLLISIYVDMDYGVYFLLLALAIYLFINEPLKAFTAGSAVTIAFSVFMYNNPIQLFSLVGLFFVCFAEKGTLSAMLPRIRINRYFFYLYYPLHLLAIYFIKLI